MASDKPSPFLVEAVKASASRFKETKNALEARQKELDAREAELETRATDLERKAERLKGERDDFQKEKEQVTAARATIDRDLGTVRVERERSGSEERRVQEWARTLNDREKAIKDNEDRVKRLDMDLSGHLKESEGKIQALLEREELAAQRERALADTIERLVGMERGLSSARILRRIAGHPPTGVDPARDGTRAARGEGEEPDRGREVSRRGPRGERHRRRTGGRAVAAPAANGRAAGSQAPGPAADGSAECAASNHPSHSNRRVPPG